MNQKWKSESREGFAQQVRMGNSWDFQRSGFFGTMLPVLGVLIKCLTWQVSFLVLAVAIWLLSFLFFFSYWSNLACGSCERNHEKKNPRGSKYLYVNKGLHHRYYFQSNAVFHQEKTCTWQPQWHRKPVSPDVTETECNSSLGSSPTSQVQTEPAKPGGPCASSAASLSICSYQTRRQY